MNPKLYTLFNEPEHLPLPVNSVRDARKYFDWFLSEIPSRIEQLHIAAATTGHSGRWDLTPASLHSLGMWLDSQLTTRPKTEVEMKSEREKVPSLAWDFLDNWELTDVSTSLCIDVGIYFGEVFRRQVPSIQWELVKSPKSHIDLFKPVIGRFAGARMNPIRLVLTLAGSKSAALELPRLYDYWQADVG